MYNNRLVVVLKYVATIMIIMIAFTSCGSSNKNVGVKSNTKTVEQVMKEKTGQQIPSNINNSSNIARPNQSSMTKNKQNFQVQYNKIDVDLTKMSSTMIYSQVSDMVYYPDKYIGQVVKMYGMFTIFRGKKRDYYNCVISDATACCQRGIEFLVSGEQNFPQEGSEIVVTGIFDTYEENGQVFCQLINANINA